MRSAILAAAILAAGACERPAPDGPPVRLVVGISDTVIVNNFRPVQLPARVLDAAGRTLPDSGVRYEWLSGTPVSLSAGGQVTCAQAGDAALRASLGAVVTHVLLRCRPVHDVRSLRMLNLVIGGPPQGLPFQAVDAAGQPVTLLTGHVTVQDSTIATVQGLNVSGRAPGSTALDMRIGDRVGHASVHVYRRVDTLEQIGPGEHLAVPVRLPGGEMRRWRLPAAPETYLVTMIPDGEHQVMPQLAVIGAGCAPWLDAQSYFCVARQDAAVIAYHPASDPPGARPGREAGGMLAIWRQEKP